MPDYLGDDQRKVNKGSEDDEKISGELARVSGLATKIGSVRLQKLTVKHDVYIL